MGKRIRNRSSEIFVLGYIDSVIDDEDVIDKLQETFETEEYMDFNKKDKKLSDNKNTESGDYDYDIESDNSDDEGDDDENDKEESGNETEE